MGFRRQLVMQTPADQEITYKGIHAQGTENFSKQHQRLGVGDDSFIFLSGVRFCEVIRK